jgi:hypothetical protein
MITWNYRVFREDDGDYVIREVFYAPDDTILGCTANAVEPIGHTLEELAQSIDEFKAALALPVLTLHDMPAPTSTPEQRLMKRRVSTAEARTLLGLGQLEESPPAAQAPRRRKAS